MTEAHPTEDLVAQNAAILGSEPSIPIPYEVNGNGDLVMRHVSGGFTKREVLAAMAMQGYLACYGGSEHEPSAISAAKSAVAYADALLKELAK